MANQIVVDLVSDTSDFQRQMKKASESLSGVGKQTEDTAGAMASVGEAMEGTETHARGTVDVLDGLQATMGLNLDGAIAYGRGIKDLADGVKTTLIPAMKAGAGQVSKMTTALLATPWGRVAAGVAAVGGALVAASHDTDEFASALDKGREAGDMVLEGWRRMANGAAEFFGFEKKAPEFGYAMDDLGYNMLSVGDAAATMAARTAAAAQTFGAAIEAENASVARLKGWADAAAASVKALAIANALGGTVSDPDGAFASAAWVEANSGQAAAVADMDRTAAKITKATGNAAKKAADGAAKATKEAFERVKPKLEAAKAKFKASVDMKETIAGLFDLSTGDDIGHNITESLNRQVRKFEEFVKKIASLRKMGLNESLVRQFVDAGPDSLDEMNRINSGNIGDINKLANRAEKTRDDFSTSEAKRRTGADPTKPQKLTIDVKGGDKELVSLIKKWVRTEGGGSVQVAFGRN